MGIPRFYRWLRNRYPQIRMEICDQNKHYPNIDHLYIDFNALIYRCLKEPGCFLKNKIQPLTIDQIYARVIEYLMNIVARADPSKLLFIAVDGVAPRAKINQSRDRRFRSSKDQAEFQKILKKLNLQDKENWKDNSISPGTQFLTNLCDTLNKHISNLMETEWKDLKVIFSDSSVPGEGQHKIMEFIRHSKREKIFHPDTSHCIYSPDADVILLGLSLEIKNVCLIRQDSMKSSFGFTAQSQVRYQQKYRFQYVFINILREYLGKEFEETMKEIPGSSVQSIINDFILLMAFIGNDFLPTEFCFALKESHMENLFTSYKQFLHQNKIFINENGKINWKCIEKMLFIAKEFQVSMLEEKIQNKKNRGIVEEKKEEDEEDDDDEVEKFQVVDKKITKGRDFYYKSRFDIKNIQTDLEFKNIIHKYLEGLQFYNSYYFIELPSWSWFYPYHYTPLLTDVYEYMRDNQISIKLEKGEPYQPFLALMFMLPISSFHLLPKVMGETIRNEESGLRSPVDYYPSQFKLDKYESLNYNKRALIPFLDEQKTRKAYKQMNFQNLSTKQKQRNQINFESRFYFNTKGKVSLENIRISSKNQNLQKELKNIFPKPNKNQMNLRFPCLQIYGNFDLDEKSKIVLKRKYVDDGNPSDLVFFNHFVGFVEEKLAASEDFKRQIENVYEKIGYNGNCTHYYYVNQAKLVREINRFNYIKTKRQVIVPDFMLMKVPKYEYIRKVEMFDNSELYGVGEEVVVLSQKYFGQRGIIEKKQKKNLYVKLTKCKPQMSQKFEQNEEKFYTLSYVGDKFGVSTQTLLVLLDEVSILPKSQKNTNTDFIPYSINVGLNIISIKDNKVVPQYARCQMQYENTSKNYDIFSKVQISERFFPILKEYLHKMAWLVDYIDGRIIERDYSFKKGIGVKDIFPREQPNIRLFREFIKLYEFPCPGIFYSIYSKVSVNDGKLKEGKPVEETIELQYYEVISKKLGKICPPPLRHEPEFHDIGDEVIILKTLEVGYIIGIDDQFIMVKLPNQEEPQKYGFIEIFNKKWGRSLAKEMGNYWDFNISYYSPQHYTKALDS